MAPEVPNWSERPEEKPRKPGKWYKVENLMSPTFPDGVFDYMLIWSPEGGLSMEDCGVLRDMSQLDQSFSHFQFIKLPIKI